MQGEYRGDFSRDTFHRANHFSRVLMQQGRVQLDADWNEQTSILLHYLRTLGRDLIGQHGGPDATAGFAINEVAGLSADFQIGAGNYYVDGILCEQTPMSVLVAVQNADSPNQVQLTQLTLDGIELNAGQWVEFFNATSGTWVSASINSPPDPDTQKLTLNGSLPSELSDQIIPMRRVLTYLTQPDLPDPDPVGKTFSTVLVYLDIWERHLTSLEKNLIREVALGGPDTASRAKVLSQVRITAKQPNSDTPIPAAEPNVGWRNWVAQVWPQWTSGWQGANRGLLKAQVQMQPASGDPCVISPESSYRGAENQLYRVEIHNGGSVASATESSGPSFKWSRENGSVAFSILKLGTSAGQTTVTLADLGCDKNLSLKTDDWVEVVDDDSALSGSVDLLLQVQAVDYVNRVVTLKGESGITVDQPPTRHPILRRWDGTGPISERNSNLPTDWIALEDAIQIQFQPPPAALPGTLYRSGDYWLIPARVATGNIEWPKLRDQNGNLILDDSDKPIPDVLPPHGIEHHYAPLAIVSLDGGTVTGVTDLRRTFGPLAQPIP